MKNRRWQIIMLFVLGAEIGLLTYKVMDVYGRELEKGDYITLVSNGLLIVSTLIFLIVNKRSVSNT